MIAPGSKSEPVIPRAVPEFGAKSLRTSGGATGWSIHDVGRIALGTWQSICLVDTNGDNPTRQVRFSFLVG